MTTSNTSANLGEEIYRLHTFDALLAGLLALAEAEVSSEIARICKVAREHLDEVCNNLDLIEIAKSTEAQHG